MQRGAEADLSPGRDGPVGQDPGQRPGAYMPDRGRQVRPAGTDVGDLGDERAVRVGGPQAEGVEGVPVLPHLVPHPELTQNTQSVALQRDAGADGADVGLDVDQLD